MIDQINARSGFSILLALCLGAIALNYSALSGYWRWDDPSILLHIQRYSFWQDFLSPAVWQEFSPSNLTPWLSLSFEVDLILFGLSTEFFYGHQLLALAAVAFALYCTLRLWTEIRFALAGACLFLLGTPTLLVAQQLMTRHYIEGAVFCLAALYFFVRYLRLGNPVLLILSALAYLLAATAKEVYVPLVILLFFIPERELMVRLRATIPHIVVAIVYTLWRGMMLGSLGGGYTESGNVLSSTSLSAITDSFLGLPSLLFGAFWPAAVLLYFSLLCSYCFLARSRMTVTILCALLILLPMVPLVSFPGITIADRYLFLPWLAFSFSVAFFADRLQAALANAGKPKSGMMIYPVLAVIFTLSLMSAVRVRSTVAEYGREFDAHGEFIWANSQELAFIPSTILLASYWYVTDLEQFKQNLLTVTSAPTAIVDPVLNDSSPATIWTYSASCQCMENTGNSLQSLRDERLSSVDDGAPLTLDYAYTSGYFDWQFGPYTDGQYHVVSDQLGLLPAPAAGRLRVNVAPGAQFYLRYTAPEGWVTYSAPQIITADAPRVFWERN